MSIHACELVHGGHLANLALEDALSRWKAGQGAFWIDAGPLDRSSLEPILDALGGGRVRRRLAVLLKRLVRLIADFLH